MRSAQASVWRSSASPASPGGSWRTHTVWNGTGASTRQAGVAATCSASQRAFAMSRRRRAWRPRTPCSRIRNQSLRRPEAAAERDAPVAQVLDLLVDRAPQVARVRAHHAHQVLRVAHVVQRAVEDGAQPLVRIEDDRVGALDAVPQRAALGEDHGRAGEGRVDVQPQAVLRARPRRSRRRDRARSWWSCRWSPRRRRARARREILPHRRIERVGPHRVALVHRHDAHVRAPEAREQRRLVDGAVAVRRHVDDERLRLGLQATLRPASSRSFARARRCRATSVLVEAVSWMTPLQALREADHLAQPVGRRLLDLGDRRARLPGEAEDAEPRADVVAEHRGQLGVRGEVAEEARVLPVREPRQHHAIEVTQDGVEALGLVRRGSRRASRGSSRARPATSRAARRCEPDSPRSSRRSGGRSDGILQGS